MSRAISVWFRVDDARALHEKVGYLRSCVLLEWRVSNGPCIQHLSGEQDLLRCSGWLLEQKTGTSGWRSS